MIRRALLLALLGMLVAACSPIVERSTSAEAFVLQPSDLTGDHWKLLPAGYWGGLAGARAACDGEDNGVGARVDVHATSESFASSAITSDRFSSSGIFSMVYTFANERDASDAEAAFVSYIDGEWAECYALQLKQAFETQMPVIAESAAPSVTRQSVHASAATFDLATPTGNLYATEIYLWRTDRVLVYLAVTGPQAQLEGISFAEVVDVLREKAAP